MLFFAWFAFVVGCCSTFREMWIYATDSPSQHHDWFGVLRGAIGAASFAVWWYVISNV